MPTVSTYAGLGSSLCGDGQLATCGLEASLPTAAGRSSFAHDLTHTMGDQGGFRLGDKMTGGRLFPVGARRVAPPRARAFFGVTKVPVPIRRTCAGFCASVAKGDAVNTMARRAMNSP